jgi:hypothetical protein
MDAAPADIAIVPVSALVKRIRVTSSSLERSEHCAYSAAGFGVDKTGIWAARGTGAHAFIVAAYYHGREAALADIPRDAPHRRLCERLDLESLPWWHGKLPAGATVRFEVSALWFGETRETRLSTSREEYDQLGPLDHAGTVDVVIDIPSQDRVDIYDIKTGAVIQVTLPAENRQLHSYAVLFSRALGRRNARLHITNVYEDGGTFTASGHDLDAIDLAAFEVKIARTLAKVDACATTDAAGGDVRPFMARGDWCKYCPRFTECPAQLTVLRALVEAVTQKQSPQIAAKDAGAAREFIKSVDKWVAELKEVIKDYARVEALPTSKPGVVYREFKGSDRDVLDANGALALLAEKYGPEVAQAATTSQTSIGAIDEALKNHAKAHGLKQAPTLREAWALLKEHGFVVENETSKVREGREETAA